MHRVDRIIAVQRQRGYLTQGLDTTSFDTAEVPFPEDGIPHWQTFSDPDTGRTLYKFIDYESSTQARLFDFALEKKNDTYILNVKRAISR